MRKFIQFGAFFLQTFAQRHKRHIFIAALIGFFITLFFINTYPLYVKLFGQQQKRIGIVGRFTPSTLPVTIQNQISLGLTRITSSGEAQASIASSWEVDPNGINYIFHLKQNLFWHDGKNFTASDINYKLRDVTFAYPQKYTLQVSLKEVYAALPVMLAKPILKPNLTGLGPYKVVKIRQNEDLILELTLSPFDKTLPILTYKFYPTNSEAILAFKLGDIDILQDLTDTEDLKQWKNSSIKEETLYDRYVGIILNLKDPLFKDKEVRQALIYAVPNETSWQKVLTPISPLSWAYSSKTRLYSYDPEAAQKILSRSPLATSSAQLVLSTFPVFLPTAQKIIDAWQKIGLNVKIKVENSTPADFQMFLMTQAIPADPDQYQYWQSTQEVTNISNYVNPKIDKLLEDGRRTLDIEKRKTIYADFQRYLVDDAPVIFLYYPKVYTVERK